METYLKFDFLVVEIYDDNVYKLLLCGGLGLVGRIFEFLDVIKV